MEDDRKCLFCGHSIEGRSDKIFCSTDCRSAYHYLKSQNNNPSVFKKINQKLKRNRSLLKHFNQAGFAMINKFKLQDEGFDPNYYTHFWKSKKGKVFLFCYEYGFRLSMEAKESKYELIKWQSHMGSI
jgi:hypothetical protein